MAVIHQESSKRECPNFSRGVVGTATIFLPVSESVAIICLPSQMLRLQDNIFNMSYKYSPEEYELLFKITTILQPPINNHV